MGATRRAVPEFGKLPQSMEPRARAVLAVVVVLVAIAVPLAVVFGDGGGDAEPEPQSTGLRVELGATGSDLTIYVEPAVNVPQRAGGRRQVVLECVDSQGERVMAQAEAWPFTDTDRGRTRAHAHMVLDPLGISAVERCQIVGTKPLLQAPVR